MIGTPEEAINYHFILLYRSFLKVYLQPFISVHFTRLSDAARGTIRLLNEMPAPHDEMDSLQWATDE